MSAGPEAEAVIPGVLLTRQGRGLLLTGPSGAGKSDAAWTLLERGYALVADDAVHVRCLGGRLLGRCPERGHGLLHLRDLGVMDVAALRGPEAVARETVLERVIELIPSLLPVSEASVLHGRHDQTWILGVALPRVRITGTQHRPVAALIEAAGAMAH